MNIWRFNCSLLKNLEYLHVQKWFKEVKVQYAVPFYHPDSIHKVEDTDIHFTIPDPTFLEMLLLNIRGNTIKYSSKLKNNQMKRKIS